MKSSVLVRSAVFGLKIVMPFKLSFLGEKWSHWLQWHPEDDNVGPLGFTFRQLYCSCLYTHFPDLLDVLHGTWWRRVRSHPLQPLGAQCAAWSWTKIGQMFSNVGARTQGDLLNQSEALLLCRSAATLQKQMHFGTSARIVIYKLRPLEIQIEFRQHKV